LKQNHGDNLPAGITFEIESGIDDLVEKLVFSARVNRRSRLAPGGLCLEMVAFQRYFEQAAE
jgi:hypothetical protein